MFISLSKDLAVIIRTKLLENLVSETDRTVRNKISDAVAEIGRQYSDNSSSHYSNKEPVMLIGTSRRIMARTPSSAI
jgi:hypothetical protein